MEQYVQKDTCKVIHKGVDENFKRIDEELNDHDTRIKTVEDAIVRLTLLMESFSKRNKYDKMLTISTFIIAIVLLALILGPEYIGKVIGGM
jgi:uncharacterized protein YdcH (DUF465 family)